MGLEEKVENKVQISDLVRKRHLKEILSNYFHTAISFYEYMKRTGDRKTKRLCTKTIHNLEQAIIKVNETKHIEILDYYYTLCIAPNFQVYAVVGSLASSPKMSYYDTDIGISEFRGILEEQKKVAEEKAKEKAESQEAIKKAKEQGKKVEMVWDNEKKKLKPVILDEKENA